MIRKSCLTAAVAASLATAAIPATAADLQYDYIEGGYQSVDLDTPNVDGDGLFLGGSLLVAQSLFVSAEYDWADFDRGVDASGFDLGLGVRLPASPELDVVLRGGYAHAEVDTDFGDFDDDGYFASGGVRWLVNEQIELNAFLDYVDLDDSGDDTALALGGVIHLQPQLALTAGVEIGDDADAFRLGLRYHFNR